MVSVFVNLIVLTSTHGVVLVPLTSPKLLVVNSEKVAAVVSVVVVVVVIPLGVTVAATASVAVVSLVLNMKQVIQMLIAYEYLVLDRPSERPRLNLKPRTVDSAPSAAPKSAGSKPDPFGGAKPVDTDKALHEIEKKHEEPKKDEE